MTNNNNTSSLTHINNKPLRERIADILRELIIKGELKPGDAIVETELASKLGVSRAPLREALQTLNTEGLVEIIPYYKTIVRHLRQRDIRELYSLRSTLETFASRLIIEQDHPQDIQLLRSICDDMVTMAKTGDATEASAIDHQFHDTVIALSDHNLLISTWSSVSQRVHQVLALRDMVRTDTVAMAESHYPLVDALEKGDVQNAAREFEEHIMDARDLTVKVWEDSDDPSSGRHS